MKTKMYYKWETMQSLLLKDENNKDKLIIYMFFNIKT